LCDNQEIANEAKRVLDERGFGLSSVRFICGTTDYHKTLEDKLSKFYETEDTILFPSCFDANEAIFEAFLTEEDFILTDSLNHASIINGKLTNFRNPFIQGSTLNLPK
jgi:glycine C-acetyltransferase